MRDIFGSEYAFRTGTVGTVAAKDGLWICQGYERDYGRVYRDAEVERLAQRATAEGQAGDWTPGWRSLLS